MESNREEKNNKTKNKKSSKPLECSSKYPVPILRSVVPLAKKKKNRDPRFDDACGYLNEELFKKSYEWVDHLKKKEMEQVKEMIKKEKDPQKKGSLQSWLQSEMSRQKSKENLQFEKDILKERKKLETELNASGKKPFYLKKSDQKKYILIEKYKKLMGESASDTSSTATSVPKNSSLSTGKTRKLENMIEKRRQKNASKQHVKLPMRRFKD